MAAIAAITITMLYFYAFTDRNQKYFSETRKASKGDNSYTVPESLKLKLITERGVDQLLNSQSEALVI